MWVLTSDQALSNYVEIPCSLRSQSCNLFGDLDYYNGYLFITLEDSAYRQPIIGLFRAQNLGYVTSGNLDMSQGGEHAMACAINPRDN